MAIQAVLTGDIVNSTRLLPAAEKKLRALLRRVLAPYRFEFYRGDSFQVYIKDAGLAFQTALLCRTAAIGLIQDAGLYLPDVRISIGIGKTPAPGKTLGAATGEAFVLSGRAFDQLAKKDTRMAIATKNELANEGLQVIAEYTNAILTMMTGKQAIVIFELLKGKSQQAAALKLQRSASTISQHVNAGRWAEIENLLRRYRNIINQLT